MIRDYDPINGVEWRFGKPNYTRVNKLYFENRSKKHAEGSLEAIVSGAPGSGLWRPSGPSD